MMGWLVRVVRGVQGQMSRGNWRRFCACIHDTFTWLLRSADISFPSGKMQMYKQSPKWPPETPDRQVIPFEPYLVVSGVMAYVGRTNLQHPHRQPISPINRSTNIISSCRFLNDV